VVVHEVRRVGVVSAPTEEEEPVEGACGVRVEERSRLLEVELSLDAEVVAQLALDLGRALRRIREVAADGGAELDRVRLREVEVGLFQERLGGLRVEVPRLLATARERDRARGEVGGDLGAGRVEVVLIC
jgi:hypothetical protein